MKRSLIIAAFAVQIITACGQGNATAGKTDSGTDKDTTWYANRIEEINTEAGKLTEEYKTIASGPQSDASNARIKQLREKYDSLTNVMKGTILEIAQKFKDSTFPAQFFQATSPISSAMTSSRLSATRRAPTTMRRSSRWQGLCWQLWRNVIQECSIRS